MRKNGKIVVFLLPQLLLGGCATSDLIKLPNGHEGYAISCNGGANKWNECYEEAGELCPNGYDIILSNGQSSPMVITTAPGVITGGALVSRELMIECKAAKAE